MTFRRWGKGQHFLLSLSFLQTNQLQIITKGGMLGGGADSGSPHWVLALFLFDLMGFDDLFSLCGLPFHCLTDAFPAKRRS